MPFQLNNDDTRADTLLTQGSMDGARAASGGIVIDGPSAIVQQYQPRLKIDPESPIVKAARKMLNLTGKPNKHGRIDNFSALVDAHKTYEALSGEAKPDAGVNETPNEAYMAATFAGMQEAVTRKCGVMPEGCFRCARDTSRTFAGSIWIRHEGDKHYIAFTDTCGNTTEERIYSCPWCRKKF